MDRRVLELKLFSLLHRSPTDIQKICDKIYTNKAYAKDTARLLRGHAAKNRVRETLKTIILSDPTLLAKAKKGEEIDTNVLSLSLLTPDVFRSTPRSNERQMLRDQMRAYQDMSGRPMQLDLGNIDGKRLQARAKFKIVGMNIPVNTGGLKGMGPVRVRSVVALSPAVGPLASKTGAGIGPKLVGWDVSNAANRVGLRMLLGQNFEKTNPADLVSELGNQEAVLVESDGTQRSVYTSSDLGSVGTWFAGTEERIKTLQEAIRNKRTNPRQADPLQADPRQADPLQAEVTAPGAQQNETIADLRQELATLMRSREVNLQLTKQIADIWKQGSYLDYKKNPYALPSRLALLSFRTGTAVTFNCKSGKDRSGALDTEIRTLSAIVERTGKVPDPEAPESIQDRELYMRIALNGGSQEIHQYNVGAKGYKSIESLPIMKRRPLTPGQSRDLIGFSKFVSS